MGLWPERAAGARHPAGVQRLLSERERKWWILGSQDSMGPPGASNNVKWLE